jgi:uncharacterized membrane protein YphA (DoxX/SURF4 family)
MKHISYTILRIGIGITFIGIGISVWMAPAAWGSFIQPWAEALLPFPVEQMMRTTAVFDILIGAWLLSGFFVWIAALLGTLHIAAVLITTTGGFNNIIIRDIGMLAASAAIFFESRSK